MIFNILFINFIPLKNLFLMRFISIFFAKFFARFFDKNFKSFNSLKNKRQVIAWSFYDFVTNHLQQ